MTKTLLFLASAVLVAGFAEAGTPTIDGTLDAGVYTELATADGTAGWSSVNADALYATDDANNWYFAGTTSAGADTWMMFGFIIESENNTIGATDDPWARAFDYREFTNAPDLIVHGNLDGGYAELWVSDQATTATTRFETGGANRVSTGDAAASVSSGVAVAEIRIPKTLLPGLGTNLPQVQFYISGNNNGHGVFDAVPDDEVAGDWNPPGSVSSLGPNYAAITSAVREWETLD